LPKTRRCDRNRKRSKRRPIYCPKHGCYLDSVSQKHPIYADRPEHLQEKGMTKKTAGLVMLNRTAVRINEEWLEKFWCQECEQAQWYRVQKMGERDYKVTLAPPHLWKRAEGTVDPFGNPSVGEFTRRQSNRLNMKTYKDYHD